MRRFILLTLLVLSSVVPPVWAEQSPPLLAGKPLAAASYADLLARAQTLRAEQSWALAQQHYEAAERVAKTESERAAAALGGLECGWRAEGDVPWSRRDEFREKWKVQFEALAKPYAKGRPLDDAGAAIELAWSDFLFAYYFQDEGALHLRKGIEYLASKPATPANVAAVVAALRERQGVGRRLTNEGIELALTQISTDQLNAPSLREEKAWLLRLKARHEASFYRGGNQRAGWLKNALNAWASAVEAAKGTALEASVGLEALVYRTSLPWFGRESKPQPEELAAVIEEGNRLAAALSGLGDEKEQTDRWRQQVKSWTRPQLRVSFPSRIVPGGAQVLKVGGFGWVSAKISLSELTPREYLEFEYDRKVAGGSLSKPISHGRELWTTHLDNPTKHPLEWGIQSVQGAPRLGPGLYFLRCSGADSEGHALSLDPQLIVVSRYSVSLVRGGRQGEQLGAVAINQETGGRESVQSIRAEWLNREGFGSADEMTDATGFVSLNHASLRQSSSFVFRIGDEWVPFFGLSGEVERHSKSQYTGELVLDQPLYEPGQVVRWKLIAREGESGSWVVPSTNDEVQVSFLADEDSSVIWTGKRTWSRYGAIEGEFTLPTNAPSGDVSFLVTRPQAEAAFRSYRAFLVDNFEPPAVIASLSLASSALELVPGGRARFAVESRYFSGGNLSGARVDFSIQVSHPRAKEEINPAVRNWISSIVSRSSQTDLDGKAFVEVSIPEQLPVGSMFHVQATIVSSAGPAVSESGRFVVTNTGLRLKAVDDSSTTVIGSGAPWTFRAVLVDGTERPTSASVDVKLERLQWVEVWVNRDGSILPEGEWRAALVKARGDREALTSQGLRQVYAGYQGKEVSTVECKSEGDGVLKVDYSTLAEGFYRVAVSVSEQSVDWLEGPHLWEPSPFFPGRFSGEPSLGVYPAASTVLSLGDGSQLSLPPETQIMPTSLVAKPGAGAVVGRFVTRDWEELVHVILSKPEGSLVSLPVSRRGRIGVFEVQVPNEARRTEQWVASLLSRDETWNIPATEIQVLSSAEPWSIEIVSKNKTLPGETIKAEVRLIGDRKHFGDAEVVLKVADQAVQSMLGSEDKENKHLPFFGAVAASAAREVYEHEREGPSVNVDPRLGIGGAFDDDAVGLQSFKVTAKDVEGSAGSFTLAGSRGVKGSLRLTPSASSATALGQGGGAEPPAPPTVGHLRVRFDATAFWAPTLRTDANGRADVSFTLPDNLTEWRWEATAIGADGQSFGRGLAFTRTDLPFQARLSLPEVVVAGDTVKPRATLINQTTAPASASVALEVSGSIHKMDTDEPHRVEVPAQAESITEWSLVAGAPGKLDAVLRAQAGSESDGMQRRAQVREDGLLQSTYASFSLEAGKKTSAGSLALPKPLDPARTAVQVRVDPVGVGALLDAIPYLVHYPFGCVEQTLNRFMPAVVVKHFLLKQGLEEEKIDARLLATEPNSGAKASLDDVIEAGLARLKSAARADGFGWWPAAPRRDLWMTAYVAWGLHLAREAGVDVDESLWETAREGTLAGAVETAASQEDRAWALAVISVLKLEVTQDKALRDAWATLFRVRADLSPSARASLLLAADRFGAPDQRGVLLRNLYDGALKEQALGMTLLHWEGRRDRCWAGDTPTEATALTLLALMQVAPQDERIEPAARWLLLNRRLERWDTTRSTAFAVVALQRWLVQRKGDPLSDEVAVFVEGKEAGRIVLSTETLLTASPVVAVPTGLLNPGSTAVEIQRLRGNTPFFVTASSEAWATGDAVKPFSQVLAIERHWQRQVAIDTVRGDVRVTPVALPALGTVRREESVQARVALKTAIDLAYVKVEVPLPGGTRPAALLSGWDARLVRASTPDEEGTPVYREAHPGKSVFFLNELPVGNWVLVFDLQAEVAGDYRTLPAEVEAMYVPEIRGNSDSRRLVIESK